MKHTRSTLPTTHSTASFWHSEPSSFLLGHRTTPTLPSSADIVIIGSGLTGSSITRFLAEDERAKDKSVVMLEAREACWGATGRNGGHCQPLLFDRSPQVAAFEIKNVQAVKSYIETHNVPCEWRTVSGCRTFWTEELMALAEQEVAFLADNAPEIASRVTVTRDKEELKKHRVPATCPGATLTSDAGSLWPYKLVSFVLEKAIRDGRLNLQTTTPVTSIRSSPSPTETDNKRIHILTTPRGEISTPTVILATNAYTSALLPSFADLIVPVRGSMSALLPPKNSTLLPNSYGMVGALNQPANNDDYLVQRPLSGVPNADGHLMFGGGRGAGTLPTVGVADDSVLDEGAARYLRSALLKILELDGDVDGLKELEAVNQWTGIMGYSRDNHPWVGQVPDLEGVWVCGGYTGHGMPNGLLCGKAVVEMVLEVGGRGDISGNDAGVKKRALQDVEDRLVANGDIPSAYLISKERMRMARVWPTVEVQDSSEFYTREREGFVEWQRGREREGDLVRVCFGRG